MQTKRGKGLTAPFKLLPTLQDQIVIKIFLPDTKYKGGLCFSCYLVIICSAKWTHLFLKEKAPSLINQFSMKKGGRSSFQWTLVALHLWQNPSESQELEPSQTTSSERQSGKVSEKMSQREESDSSERESATQTRNTIVGFMCFVFHV